MKYYEKALNEQDDLYDEQSANAAFIGNPTDSTAERLKLAKALQNLGHTTLDKRIYKKKK